jgi:mercuric ion transport protein
VTTTLLRWREGLTATVPVAVLGTLVCCAIPITLVALGAGSVVATLVSTAPWLVTLTQHKAWVFAFSGLLLLGNYWALYRSGGVACQPGGVCHPGHPVGRWMRRVFWASTVLYGIGFVAAYLSLPIAQLLGY